MLGAKAAAALDQELMGACAFSIDQLMELAGLSVSQAGMIWRLPDITLAGSGNLHPSFHGSNIKLCCSIPCTPPSTGPKGPGRMWPWK